MNKDSLQGNWQELKGKVKQKWANLTDDDIKAIEGNYEELCGRVQKAYGYEQGQANTEVDQFLDEQYEVETDR